MNGKFLAAVAVLALSAPVLADSGFYIQADAGDSKIKLKETESLENNPTVSQSGFSPRLTVGYDFGNNSGASAWITPATNLLLNTLNRMLN